MISLKAGSGSVWAKIWINIILTGMLILGLTLKATFLGLGFLIVWPWP